MTETRSLHVLGATGVARREQFEGRQHLVVPVVALMEGVIHAVNAQTPEFVSADTLQRAALSWNGRPITFGHPAEGGKQISANVAKVLEQQAFGRIFNSRVEGKKLLCEAWVDVEKAKQVGAEALLRKLEEGQVTEVSVGAFVMTDAAPGNFNGRQYTASWKTVSGDHLAFLDTVRGACSVAMGCGTGRFAQVHQLEAEEMRALTEVEIEALLVILARHQEESMSGKRTLKERLTGLLAALTTATPDELKTLVVEEKTKSEYSDCEKCDGEGCEYCNETGLWDEDADGPPSRKDMAAYAEELHTRALTISATCKDVEHKDGGEPAGGTMTKDERGAIIKTLVGCECSGFTTADEKMLEGASDERLTAFEATRTKVKAEREALKTAQAEATTLKAAAAKPTQMTKDEMLAAMPEVKALVDNAKAAEEARKTELVASLKTAQDVHSEEELTAMTLKQLEDIGKLVKIEPVDYSGRPAPRVLRDAKDVYSNPPDPYAGIRKKAS